MRIKHKTLTINELRNSAIRALKNLNEMMDKVDVTKDVTPYHEMKLELKFIQDLTTSLLKKCGYSSDEIDDVIKTSRRVQEKLGLSQDVIRRKLFKDTKNAKANKAAFRAGAEYPDSMVSAFGNVME